MSPRQASNSAAMNRASILVAVPGSGLTASAMRRFRFERRPLVGQQRANFAQHRAESAAAAPPHVKRFGEAELPPGGVGALPYAGGKLVRLCHGRVGVDGTENLVQAQSVLHGGDVFEQQVGGVLGGDGG